MAIYKKIFSKFYPNGWKDKPTKTTSIKAQALNNYDAAIISIENELVNHYSTFAQKSEIPKKVSAFENDKNYVTDDQIGDIPTKVSDLENDAEYVTLTGVESVVNDKMSGKYVSKQGDSMTGELEMDNSSIMFSATGGQTAGIEMTEDSESEVNIVQKRNRTWINGELTDQSTMAIDGLTLETIDHSDATSDRYDGGLVYGRNGISASGEPSKGNYLKVSVKNPFETNINSNEGYYEFMSGYFYGYDVDNARGADIGSSYTKWNNIYATNGTIQTSDRNEKNNIADMTAEQAQALIYGLKPSTYQMNAGTSGRTHWGMISQDIEELLDSLGWDSLDFAGFIKSPKVEIVETEDEKGRIKRTEKVIEGEYTYSLRYDEFVAPIIKVVQEQKAEIDSLKERLAAIEAKLA